MFLLNLRPDFTLVSYSAYFFDPKYGGDMFLRNVGCENLKSYNSYLVLCLNILMLYISVVE
jgi:hypothetical protein